MIAITVFISLYSCPMLPINAVECHIYFMTHKCKKDNDAGVVILIQPLCMVHAFWDTMQKSFESINQAHTQREETLRQRWMPNSLEFEVALARCLSWYQLLQLNIRDIQGLAICDLSARYDVGTDRNRWKAKVIANLSAINEMETKSQWYFLLDTCKFDLHRTMNLVLIEKETEREYNTNIKRILRGGDRLPMAWSWSQMCMPAQLRLHICIKGKCMIGLPNIWPNVCNEQISNLLEVETVRRRILSEFCCESWKGEYAFIYLKCE